MTSERKRYDDWKQLERILKEIAALRKGWDDAGAEPIDMVLLTSVYDLLVQIRTEDQPAPTRVIPSPDGSILVEWSGEGYYQEIEIQAPFHGDVMTQLGASPAEHTEISWPCSIQQGNSDPVWSRVYYLHRRRVRG